MYGREELCLHVPMSPCPNPLVFLSHFWYTIGKQAEIISGLQEGLAVTGGITPFSHSSPNRHITIQMRDPSDTPVTNVPIQMKNLSNTSVTTVTTVTTHTPPNTCP